MDNLHIVFFTLKDGTFGINSEYYKCLIVLRKPLNLYVEPLDIMLEPLNLMPKPLNIVRKPLNLYVKPLNIVRKPLNPILKTAHPTPLEEITVFHRFVTVQ